MLKRAQKLPMLGPDAVGRADHPLPADWEFEERPITGDTAEELARAAERQIDAAAYTMRRLVEDLRPYILPLGPAETELAAPESHEPAAPPPRRTTRAA